MDLPGKATSTFELPYHGTRALASLEGFEYRYVPFTYDTAFTV